MASTDTKVATGPTGVVAGQPYNFQDNVRRFVKRSWFACILAFLELGASIAVISLVRRQLDLWIVKVVGNVFVGSYTCFLTSDGDAWGCRYGYSLGAVGLALVIGVLVMQCIELSDSVTSGYHMGEAIMDALGAVWWLVGAIILTIEDKDADAAGVLQGSYRNGVIALCWISFALFLLLAMLQLNMAVTQWREYIQRGDRDTAAKRGDMTRISVQDFDRQLPPEGLPV